VDATEYNLQKKGYVDAFNNPTIQSNIASFASSGGIAVAFAEWSSTGNQIMLVNWTQISTAAQAAAFTAAINATPRLSVAATRHPDRQLTGECRCSTTPLRAIGE